MFIIEEEKDDLKEDIVDLKKKPRTAAEAKSAAVAAAVQGFNPFESLYLRHTEAKKKALKVFKNEMRDAKDDVNKVTLSTNFISGKSFVLPKSGKLIIAVHVYLAGKKSFLQRLATGSIGNWFTRGKMLGITALQTYVKEFAGEAFAKQISKDNVFNGVGEGENEGKASYYCALKIPAYGKEQ